MLFHGNIFLIVVKSLMLLLAGMWHRKGQIISTGPQRWQLDLLNIKASDPYMTGMQ